MVKFLDYLLYPFIWILLYSGGFISCIANLVKKEIDMSDVKDFISMAVNDIRLLDVSFRSLSILLLCKDEYSIITGLDSDKEIIIKDKFIVRIKWTKLTGRNPCGIKQL